MTTQAVLDKWLSFLNKNKNLVSEEWDGSLYGRTYNQIYTVDSRIAKKALEGLFNDLHNIRKHSKNN